MKVAKTIIILSVIISIYLGIALSFESTNSSISEADTIQSVEKIASFLKKSRSLKNDFKISDLELRLAINFKYNSDSLTLIAKEQLDNLAQVLQNPEFSELSIELAGHTCDLGNADYNYDLSKRRVESALEYLTTELDVDTSRISIRAYGESMPLIPGARTEEERRVNRRVVTYLPENKATIEKMLQEMPYTQGFSWAVFGYTKDKKTKLVNYDGSSVLKSEDEYRVYLRPARKKYVYIYQEDSKGNGQWLFPRKDVQYENPLTPGEYFLPSKSKVFVLDNNVGTETIYLVVTDNPAEELESLIQNQHSNLTADTITKTVRTRGLKKIKIGPKIGYPVESKDITKHTITISSGTQMNDINKSDFIPGNLNNNIANIMAQYTEFYMVLQFEHR